MKDLPPKPTKTVTFNLDDLFISINGVYMPRNDANVKMARRIEQKRRELTQRMMQAAGTSPTEHRLQMLLRATAFTV